ncbi:MAG: 30S ribosomal protein S19e [Candidatus Hodarchaeales archaeon]|jgi:small subunit ribosomal protein S19e
MVPAEILINEIVEVLKSNEKIFTPPAWTNYVKLGVTKQNAPEQGKDWWYVRVASILRKIYLQGPIGVVHLRKAYGGRKNRGSKPERTASGSGAIIRNAIHQLEKAGYVTLVAGDGRIMTPAGRSFVDSVAFKIKQELPELSSY